MLVRAYRLLVRTWKGLKWNHRRSDWYKRLTKFAI